MNINLNSLLPDDLSDEAAFQLVEFFAELAIALENYYYASLRRYVKNNTPIQRKCDPPAIPDGEVPF